jgi:hypothetical protein
MAFGEKHDRHYSRLEATIDERTARNSFFGMVFCNERDQIRAVDGQVNVLVQDPNRYINQPMGLEKRDLIERQR